MKWSWVILMERCVKNFLSPARLQGGGWIDPSVGLTSLSVEKRKEEWSALCGRTISRSQDILSWSLGCQGPVYSKSLAPLNKYH